MIEEETSEDSIVEELTLTTESPSENWKAKDWTKFTKWLKGMLQVSPEVSITFIKKNGTERVMKCTLHPDILPPMPVTESSDPTETKKKRKVPEETMAVYDVEAGAWRSFTIKAVKQVRLSV